MVHPAFVARQRDRWLRCDAHVWVRPDAAKFLKPGADPADVYPALAQQRDRQRDRARQAHDRDIAEVLAQERPVLDGLRVELAQVKSDLAWRRLRDAIVQKYSPNQPRVPAGSGRESGQWTSGRGGSLGGMFGSQFADQDDDSAGDGGQLDEIVVDGTDWADSNPGFDGPADSFDSSDGSPNSGFESIADRALAGRPAGITDTRVVSDADPEVVKPGEQYAANTRSFRDANGNPYYRPGGHHVYPQAEFNKLDLPPETRRVFDAATTGKMFTGTTVRTSPDGVPLGHFWDKAHREYSSAVNELATDFIQRNKIDPRSMTPPQAMDLLAEIRKSEDPRISDYNRAMRMLNRIFRFRSGRSE